MVNFEDLSASLQGEVMSDMADGFFGARCAIDDEVDIFRLKAGDVILAGQRALCKGALLSALLLHDKGLPEFFTYIGVNDAAPFALRLSKEQPCLFVEKPLGWTKKSRFSKLIVNVYDAVYEAVHRYHYGYSYKQPGERLPGRTLGFKRYAEWCDEINKQIESVNKNHAPSCVLGMARSMNVQADAMERASGTGVDGISMSMDESLCIRPIACELPDVGHIPELPPKAEVEDLIKEYVKELYGRYGADLEKTYTELEHSRDCLLEHDLEDC